MYLLFKESFGYIFLYVLKKFIHSFSKGLYILYKFLFKVILTFSIVLGYPRLAVVGRLFSECIILPWFELIALFPNSLTIYLSLAFSVKANIENRLDLNDSHVAGIW